MPQYKIEKKIEYAPDGSVISTFWDIYDEEGRVFRSGLDTEEMAQEILEYLEIADKLNPNQHQRIDPN
ncbi:Uncharacterised protein [Klebsiella michiganensis]|uniref:Uncharacterized protein n=2 Tax=Klebsiella TaxID=570 RepID=A0A7H4M7E4_9ENTR|nr:MULTISPECIES: hypothetical protein [Klebsiella]EAO3172658.1 hypothetical protein [Salmonella enterica]EAR5802502.1 hypothetical protein [Salmonella enterica]EDC3622057.1 hypothetical protein [Salmonella enterica]EDW7871651.1 hypothetical protein [Salmonella enterica]EEG6732657.1 hypothetical protein [Salmonella enterica]